MPHRMTRLQAARRLAIRAYLDAFPGTSYKVLATLFSTSYSTVRDATRFTTTEWARKVAGAPPGPVAPARRPITTKRATRHLATSASLPPELIPRPAGATTRSRNSTPREDGTGEGDIDIPEPVDFDQDEPAKEGHQRARRSR